ncbi:MAG: polysaccharide deacetylase [Spirochaetales bacterium]|nr:polysaccharide deacetylase [Spirochaetales bacterium]
MNICGVPAENSKRKAMRSLFFIILVLGAQLAFGETTFSSLDLADDSSLLFKARTVAPGNGSYDTAFLSDVSTRALTQLSFFPEVAMLTGDANNLQIINRYGVFRSDDEMQRFSPVTRFPSFVNGAEISSGKLNVPSSSPDGRYLLIMAKTREGMADLLLYTTESGDEATVSADLEFSISAHAARWSPRSKFFVYAKKGVLYYFSLDQLIDERIVNEEFRAIGPGTMANIRWGKDGSIFYIKNALVYRIRSEELFTRSLYSKLMNIGTVVGKIPFEFDHNFDEFWISPDGAKIILSKGSRNIFLFFLQTDDYLSTGDVQSLPYLFLPRNTVIKKVLWSERDIIAILTGSIERGEQKTTVFTLDLSVPSDAHTFRESSEDGVIDIALSPNSDTLAVVKSSGVVLRSYDSWQDIGIYDHPGPLFVLWRDDRALIISGASYTELVDLREETSRVICLSQVEDYGFTDEDSEVLLSAADKVFRFARDRGLTPVSDFQVGEANVASSSYRVYLEPIISGRYRNMIMVRKTIGYGTSALFEAPSRTYEDFPAAEELIDFRNFTHGSRIRRREIALVFNAIDSVEGLTIILNALKEYRVRCTFFINGEFIRRHPGAVKEIADSGHEVGSLFFTYFNMTDASFKIDREFIKQGLARNEDDYYTVSGKELSLMWHAPYYFTNSDIISAARDMNYSYIGRDIDPLDWVSPRDPTLKTFYMPSTALIERILKLKKPGSIIPIRIGRTEPGREDYLFHKLDVLINGLIRLGYSIVPVSVLMDHAR